MAKIDEELHDYEIQLAIAEKTLKGVDESIKIEQEHLDNLFVKQYRLKEQTHHYRLHIEFLRDEIERSKSDKS